MSNNCLLTKLKATVSDDSLPKLGIVEITYSPTETGEMTGGINSSIYSKFVLASGAEAKFTLVGNAHFVRSGTNLGKEVTLEGGPTSTRAVGMYSEDATPFKLIIEPPYDILTHIGDDLCSGFPGGYVSKIVGLDSVKNLGLKKLNYANLSGTMNLNDIILNNDYVNINCIQNGMSANYMQGDIAVLGQNKNALRCDFHNCKALTGSIESMVENFAAAGIPDNTTIEVRFGGNENITLNNIKGTTSVAYTGQFTINRSGNTYTIVQSSTTKATYVVGMGWSYS